MKFKSIPEVIWAARQALLDNGTKVYPKKWQATEVGTGMHEIFNFNFECPIPLTKELLAEQVKPDLEWADEHFKERICGEPLNPAPSYKRWPYYRDDGKFRRCDEKFAHTYPERIWPKAIVEDNNQIRHMQGIRFRYGDLRDIVNLLHEQPLTRQAYLPIWFPEDTGAHHGERVPCTLGYWFTHRDDTIDIYYTMRACDYRRHLHNDIYFAGRLLQWVLEELKKEDIANDTWNWDTVKPGKLVMQIHNLHIFDGEERVI